MCADAQQLAQPAAQRHEVAQLRVDLVELRGRGLGDVLGRSAVVGLEHVCDLSEGEAESFRAPNELEPLTVPLRVFALAGTATFWHREQASPLVEAHGVDADASRCRQLPDRE